MALWSDVTKAELFGPFAKPVGGGGTRQTWCWLHHAVGRHFINKDREASPSVNGRGWVEYLKQKLQSSWLVTIVMGVLCAHVDEFEHWALQCKAPICITSS
ncbi:hypothetical protein ATANTOWER_005755 [Ataeniobius toweri]|uniref:Uncharacterized protein n=1 Tax=Ataeniobius toweri TaxID=208326 RepID=A0ABU7CIL2_9TELE|nr:hypothetical protein [Ataeniobius toweri]